MGDQHLVRVHAPGRGDRLGARQGGGIDETAEQENVFGARQCLEARSKMRVLAADTGMPPAFSREYLQF